MFLLKYQFCEALCSTFCNKSQMFLNEKNLCYFLLIFRTAAVMKNSHFGPDPPAFSHFRGPQMPEQAHLVRGACLGSRPCLQGEPELMVLKWRPDGDGGLIAAEGTSESCPLLLSKYFKLKLPVCSSFPSLIIKLLFYPSVLHPTLVRAFILFSVLCVLDWTTR